MNTFSFNYIADFVGSKGSHPTFRLFLYALILYCAIPYQETIADTANANLSVTATVASRCVVQNGNLAFGTYDPIETNSDQALQAVGHFDVRCLKNSSAELQLSNGNYSSNAAGTSRAMSAGDGSNFLSYDLYTNSSSNAVWNTTNTVTYTASDTNPVSISVYGKIPANQLVAPGNYSDTVTVTANF